MIGLLTRLAASIAVAATFAPAVWATTIDTGYYTEQGDAGDRLDPQALSPAGMEFIGIRGNLGGSDLADAFLFFFGGGEFAVEAAFDGASPGPGIEPNGTVDVITLALYAGWPIDDSVAPLAVSPDGYLSLTLDAGNYILEASVSGDDPPFTIGGLLGPTTAQQTILGSPVIVPEPATVGLLGLGVAGVARRGLRRRR